MRAAVEASTGQKTLVVEIKLPDRATGALQKEVARTAVVARKLIQFCSAERRTGQPQAPQNGVDGIAEMPANA